MEQTQESLLTTEQAATQLGITVRSVERLVASGQLEGSKMARDWRIVKQSVTVYQEKRRRVGRPRKEG